MSIHNFNIADVMALLGMIIGAAFVLVIVRRWLVKFSIMSDEEKIALTQRLLQNLAPIALALVTKAEKDFNSNPMIGMGKLKRSQVLGDLYAMVPDEFKPYVTEENLSTILEIALDEAKDIWGTSKSFQSGEVPVPLYKRTDY